MKRDTLSALDDAIEQNGGAGAVLDSRPRPKKAKPPRSTRNGLPVEYGETAMSREFASRFVDEFRYVPEWGSWLAWDGSRWAPDVEGRARLAAKGLCDDFAEFARHDPLFGEEASCERAALRCQAKRTVDAVLDLATVEAEIVIRANQLDANEWLLNTPTGTINLLDGSQREHRREDLITKITSVGADSVASASTFETFLYQVTCEDLDLIEYLQTALGACLSGALQDHWLMFWFGPGRNGRTRSATPWRTSSATTPRRCRCKRSWPTSTVAVTRPKSRTCAG